MATTASPATSSAPATAVEQRQSSDPIVTRYEFDNKLSTSEGTPDLGVVTTYDNATPIDNLDNINFAPVCTSVAYITLDPSQRELTKERIAVIAERVAAIVANPLLGPYTRTAQRPYPLAEVLQTLDSAKPGKKKHKHLPDPAMWDSVIADNGDASPASGAFLGFFVRNSPLGLPEELFVAVRSTAGITDTSDFRIWFSSKQRTYGELTDSPQYAELISHTERNARRLISEFLIEMGLHLSVGVETDSRAVQSGAEVSTRLVCDLCAKCYTNVLSRIDANTVGYYSEVVPLAYCEGVDSIVRVLHPAQGIALFPMDVGDAIRSTNPARGFAATSKRNTPGEAPQRYNPESVEKTYFALTPEVGISDYIAKVNVAAVDVKSMSAPSGFSPNKQWSLLQPLAVMFL